MEFPSGVGSIPVDLSVVFPFTGFLLVFMAVQQLDCQSFIYPHA